VNRTSYNEADISDKSSWLKDRYTGFTSLVRDKILNKIEYSKFNFTSWNEIEFTKRMSSLAAVDELVQSLHK
jgi:hypothetical protein